MRNRNVVLRDGGDDIPSDVNKPAIVETSASRNYNTTYRLNKEKSPLTKVTLGGSYKARSVAARPKI